MAARTLPYARDAVAHLSSADPVMARLIGEIGQVSISLRPHRFQSLVRAIVFQQLAGRAAQTIYERFVALFPGTRFPTPQQVLAIHPRRLRSAGLSRQKSRYIRDLARHVADGAINFRRFARMDDEEIIVELTRVKGIGRWTAEMFLMFNLGRPDVLPVDDLGFRNAVHRAYSLKKIPNGKELKEFGERWRPYRTVATWYMWRSLAVKLPDADQRPAPRPKRKPRAARPEKEGR